MNISYAFNDQFENQGVTCQLNFEHDEADSHKVDLDYKTINAAFYNFFDNALKYVKTNSQIRFYFNVPLEWDVCNYESPGI